MQIVSKNLFTHLKVKLLKKRWSLKKWSTVKKKIVWNVLRINLKQFKN